MRRTTTTMIAAAVALMPVIAEAKKDDYKKIEKKIEKAYKEQEKAHKKAHKAQEKANKAQAKADKEWRKANGGSDTVYVTTLPRKSVVEHKTVHRHVYRGGDRIESNYERVTNPEIYGLNPNFPYYLAADRIYRMDPETLKVVAMIGLAADLLN
ncbi:hypothetical protein [Neptunicoccus cionae]|uniref:Uncharacterized protein n=1 Tax=Neptunicoccus cionae TaxID=2035344 RepID=A0A916VNJ0_9RHOB|nr:hypothetical protein [Amylibacter cionae]GGA11663.1 hypothetical protein GCM10011498_09880 [Amylibacter cionae]